MFGLITSLVVLFEIQLPVHPLVTASMASDSWVRFCYIQCGLEQWWRVLFIVIIIIIIIIIIK